MEAGACWKAGGDADASGRANSAVQGRRSAWGEGENSGRSAGDLDFLAQLFVFRAVVEESVCGGGPSQRACECLARRCGNRECGVLFWGQNGAGVEFPAWGGGVDCAEEGVEGGGAFVCHSGWPAGAEVSSSAGGPDAGAVVWSSDYTSEVRSLVKLAFEELG